MEVAIDHLAIPPIALAILVTALPLRAIVLGTRGTVREAIPDTAARPLFPRVREGGIGQLRIRAHGQAEGPRALGQPRRGTVPGELRLSGPWGRRARTKLEAINDRKHQTTLPLSRVLTLSQDRREAAHRAHAETKAWGGGAHLVDSDR